MENDKQYKFFNREILKEWYFKKGLILITGGTGSGKSTTLASMVQKISNDKKSHIITIEDPIEYLYPHSKAQVNQREVGLDTDSFASGLKSALRQDPDVLLIGEIRDEETANIAVKFSMTGHLVFSTVHANDATSTILRLLDLGILMVDFSIIK